MTQGWECPKCGRVWAPHTVQCLPCCWEVERKETAVMVARCHFARAITAQIDADGWIAW